MGVLLKRSAESCRVVKSLNRGLPPGAKFSLINRMIGVSLHLNDVAISILRKHTAARRTFPAGCRVPSRLAWNNIFGRNDVGNKPSSRLPASGQSSRTGQSSDLKEISTTQISHKRFPHHLRIFDGRLRNGFVLSAAMFALHTFFILCPNRGQSFVNFSNL